MSVRLSVPSIDSRAVAGGVCCWAPSRQEISIDSCRRTQQQLRRSTALSGKRGQCHVDNRGTRLNLLLLHCSAFQRSELFVSSSFRDLIYKAFTVISTGNLHSSQNWLTDKRTRTCKMVMCPFEFWVPCSLIFRSNEAEHFKFDKIVVTFGL